MAAELETTPSWLLHAFAARAEGTQPLRSASDACAAYAGWLSASWPSLDAQAQSLLVDVGALLHASATLQGGTPGVITAGIQRLVGWTSLK